MQKPSIGCYHEVIISLELLREEEQNLMGWYHVGDGLMGEGAILIGSRFQCHPVNWRRFPIRSC